MSSQATGTESEHLHTQQLNEAQRNSVLLKQFIITSKLKQKKEKKRLKLDIA